MPIYEYVCRACRAETEIMHRISDPPARKCPQCGKLKLEKQVSAAGFRLGGGGWYETDFKKDGKRNLAGEKGAGDKSEPARTEAKAEKKEPAKKEPAKTESRKPSKAA